MLLDWMMVGVRPAQHQPPHQCGEARNGGIKNRGAFHAVDCGLGGRW